MGFITESKLRHMYKYGLSNPLLLSKRDKLTPAAADYLRGLKIQWTYIDNFGENSEIDRRAEIEESEKSEKSENSENNLEKRKSCEIIRHYCAIAVGVSNRHVHLSPEHVERLFGSDSTLTPFRNLSQPGQFAAKEMVTLLGPKGYIQSVRVLGPARGTTQVEISRTDGYTLGLHPPVRLSGCLEGTPGITLIGPSGSVTLEQGVIAAQSHVHMTPSDADTFGVKDGDKIAVRTAGIRPVIFPDVAVRVHPRFILDLHLDLDEANASYVSTGDKVYFIGKAEDLFSNMIGG